MAPRRGLVASIARYQRDVARAQAAQVRAQVQAQREAERTRKAYERARAAGERDAKRLYGEARAAEVDAMNAGVAVEVASLETLLEATLAVDDYLDFDSMKSIPELPPFDPGALGVPTPAPDASQFSVPEIGAKRFLPGAKEKHAQAVAAAAQQYDAARAEHLRREQQRVAELREARQSYEQWTAAKARGQNRAAR